MELIYDLSELDDVAGKILAFAKAKTLLFEAPMGAGKTTLIKALCKQLGVTDPVSSPTFSIVNEYVGSISNVLHFDLYRLENQNELIAIGFEDYIHRRNTYFFIEWPEKAMKVLAVYYFIRIFPLDQTTRKLTITGH